MVAGWMSRTASRQTGATRAVRTIMKRCQGVHRTRPVLPLCDDKLLTKKRVLRDQVYAVANEIRGHPGNEPKRVDHVSVLHRLCADVICSQDGHCRAHGSRRLQQSFLL